LQVEQKFKFADSASKLDTQQHIAQASYRVGVCHPSARNAAVRQDDDPTCPRSRIPEKRRNDSLNVSDVRHEFEKEYENENDIKNDNGNGNLDVCLEAKEPVNYGDCERACSGSGYRYDYDFLRRRDPGMNDRDDENAKIENEIENRSNADSVDSSNKKNRDLKEEVFNEIDARSIDEEPRFLFHDDVSVKSRSLSRYHLSMVRRKD